MDLIVRILGFGLALWVLYWIVIGGLATGTRINRKIDRWLDD